MKLRAFKKKPPPVIGCRARQCDTRQAGKMSERPCCRRTGWEVGSKKGEL